MPKDIEIELEDDSEIVESIATIVEKEAEPEYIVQPSIKEGWASGYCEVCHERYNNAPVIDGVVYPPCHTKL